MGVGLLVLGVAFLVAEIFLPSGLFGVSGFISFIIGIFMIAPNVYFAVSSIALSIIFFAFILFILAKSIPKNSLYKTLLLKTKLDSEGGFLSSKENTNHIGEIMEVDTFLRPSGRIKKDDVIYDAMSESEFIEKGQKVKVVGNKGYILIVKRFEE